MKKINWKNFFLICALVVGVILPSSHLAHAAEKKMDTISVMKIWNGKAQDKAYFMIEKEVAEKAGEPKFQRIQEQPFEITKSADKGEYVKEVTVESKRGARYIVYETDATGRKIDPYNVLDLNGVPYYSRVKFARSELRSAEHTIYHFEITNTELDKFQVSKKWVGEMKPAAYFKVKYSKPNLGYWFNLDDKIYVIRGSSETTINGIEKFEDAEYKIVETDKDGKEFSDEITIDGTKYKVQVSGDKTKGFVIKNETPKVTTTSQATTTVAQPTTKPTTATKVPTTTKSSTKPKAPTTTKATTKPSTKPSTKATTKHTTKATTKNTTKPSVKTEAVYRLYHAGIKRHLYTKSAYEAKVLSSRGWNFEGEKFRTVSQGTSPVYRLYHSGTREHLYTTSTNERDTLKTRSWRYEGIAWYSTGKKPIYRLYHAGLKVHLYTADANEKNTLSKRGWKYEGIAFYVEK